MEIGDFFELEKSFDQEEVELFMKVSGDNNPVHWDADFTRETVFKRPIVHGMLVGSILSKIIGCDFPGNGTIYLSQAIKFMAPVYVGIVYKFRVEIEECYMEKNRLSLLTTVHNLENGDLILNGKALVSLPSV